MKHVKKISVSKAQDITTLIPEGLLPEDFPPIQFWIWLGSVIGVIKHYG